MQLNWILAEPARMQRYGEHMHWSQLLKEFYGHRPKVFAERFTRHSVFVVFFFVFWLICTRCTFNKYERERAIVWNECAYLVSIIIIQYLLETCCTYAQCTHRVTALSVANRTAKTTLWSNMVHLNRVSHMMQSRSPFSNENKLKLFWKQCKNATKENPISGWK